MITNEEKTETRTIVTLIQTRIITGAHLASSRAMALVVFSPIVNWAPHNKKP